MFKFSYSAASVLVKLKIVRRFLSLASECMKGLKKNKILITFGLIIWMSLITNKISEASAKTYSSWLFI